MASNSSPRSASNANTKSSTSSPRRSNSAPTAAAVATISDVDYWIDALEKAKARVKQLKIADNEADWARLQRAIFCEQLAQACLGIALEKE